MNLQNKFPDAPKDIRPYLNCESTSEIHIGCTNTSVFKITKNCNTYYLKSRIKDKHVSFQNEINVLSWLKNKLPVAEVIEYAMSDTHEFLLTSEVPGINCVDAMQNYSYNNITAWLVEGLQIIHSVDISKCPFNEGLDIKLKNAKYNLENKLIDVNDFDPERKDKTVLELYDFLVTNLPDENHFVFNHGDYCLPNILVNNGKISGYIDVDRSGISDRYNDLAIASRSIKYNLGEEYEKLFFKLYGISQLDLEKIKYYRTVDEFF